MQNKDLNFVIPTYRLRDAGETIEAYDKNFFCNGHSPKIFLFDDSSLGVHEKYYPMLEQTKTHSPIYYVGPKEKEQFIIYLSQRLGDKKLESIVRNLFRPSYGGNRNFSLIYTLGNLVVSADDDMRPYGLVEDSVESLREHEISRGKLMKRTEGGFAPKSFDILSTFIDVLGKKVSDLPPTFLRGELLNDTAMHLETNATKGAFRENSLLLEHGPVANESVVKIAQTFRSGTNDIDAIDFIELYLADDTQMSIDELNDVYVLVNFRPVVTNKNWRMDCGVAGYDNSLGLPPFFPTRLRFEDYIYRLWIQQDNIVAAHVDSAQHHMKNNYMRNPLASEIFNEELANLLKKKIKRSISNLDDLSISFDYDGEVTAQDTEEILPRIREIYHRVLNSAKSTVIDERKNNLRAFAIGLERTFYNFEPDFFQQNVARIVDDVISQIKSSIELWPALVEICYLQKHRKGLPQTLVKNVKALH
ncbi:MAG: hypothetical protein JWQ35_246 [Bacteriovoracaceae bacterium]|nr:hypothetical protein [Bacteriovoracaceae bacterium]